MANDNDLITDEQIRRMLDDERGTLFDWLEFPGFLEFEKGKVIEYPDREWVADQLNMLRCDGQAQQLELALTMPLRAANLTIEQPKDDSGGRITESVEKALFTPSNEGGMRTPFDQVFAQMTLATSVRRTYHELVWTRHPDGHLCFDKIAWRPPASCEMVRHRKTGDPDGFRQFVDWDSTQRSRAGVDWMGFIEIPRQRSVIHINNQWRDPVFGWSDLEVTNWAWNMKKQVLQLWFGLLKRAAQPWVLAYGDSDPEAKNNAKQISRLASGGVAAVRRPTDPQQRMYDVLSSGAEGAAPLFQAMVGYLDGMMSASVMAGFMDLAGANNNPTRASTALSSDHSGLFLQSRRGAAKELEATVNSQIVLPYVHVNYGPNAPMPKFKVEKISMDQVEKAMALLGQLGSSQSPIVPPEFIDMLIERVAQYLDLDDAKIRKMIADRAKRMRAAMAQAGAPQTDPASPEGNLQDAVMGALGVVRDANGSNPPPPPQEEAA